MDAPDTQQDWTQWRIYVLKELERQNGNIEALHERLDKCEKECMTRSGDMKADIREIFVKIGWQSALVSALVAVGIMLATKFL